MGLRPRIAGPSELFDRDHAPALVAEIFGDETLNDPTIRPASNSVDNLHDSAFRRQGGCACRERGLGLPIACAELPTNYYQTYGQAAHIVPSGC